jgi:hypothetical protein
VVRALYNAIAAGSKGAATAPLEFGHPARPAGNKDDYRLRPAEGRISGANRMSALGRYFALDRRPKRAVGDLCLRSHANGEFPDRSQ